MSNHCSLKIRSEKERSVIADVLHCDESHEADALVVTEVLYKRMINYVYVYWRLESCS